MNRGVFAVAFASALIATAGIARAQQYPIMDEIARKVVQKYRNASCEQLWQHRSKAKTPREEEMIQMLRNDPQMRRAFIDRVAAPIANKMFECGLLP
jgi:isopentenyl diphosphate isomerase/L-lactate dehydrogenase-like FMN-dependent dehydrogenase